MTTTLHYVNPRDRDIWKHRFILCFGAYGDTHIMACADSLDSALDECVDFIAERFPGILADDQVNEAYEEALAEGMTEEEAQEAAEVDVTRAGNCGNAILSWEWAVVSEDPSRATLKAYEKIEVKAQ